jgi:hypothetical protein
MDQLHERLVALEAQVHTLTQHTHTAQRRLRWWRGLACGLAVAGLLVSGGVGNTASEFNAAVSGGANITQETAAGWSAGSGADEVVVGNFRSP